MEIEKRLLEFVAVSTGSDQIQLDTDLIVGNLLDSLLLMELVMLAETEWGVQLQGDDIAAHNFQSVAQLARLIQTRRLAKAC